jgi:hypothetical protein
MGALITSSFVTAPPYERYTDEISRALGYLGTWMPQETLRLGDIGAMVNRTIEVSETLAALGVQFEERADENLGDWGFASSGAVTLSAETDLKAGVPATVPVGAIGGELRFSHDHAVFFRMEEAHVRRIDNLDEVRDAILKLADAGKWKRDWLVVTQLWEAQRCTAMLAGSNDASARVVVHASALPGVNDVASGTARVAVAHHSGMDVDAVITGGATPLYRAHRVVRRVSGLKTKVVGAKGKLEPGEGAASESKEANVLEEYSYGDDAA